MSLENLFWDSCLFIRYVINDTAASHFADISRFVEDAKAGKRKVHFSTLTFAEMRQEHFNGAYGSVKEFFDDLGSNFSPIEPNPNIMIAAGEIRSATSTNPGDPNGKSRVVATPDAIILASALYARDALGIADLTFHTTDDGKSRGYDGKCIPLLSFEKWYPEVTRTPAISKVCGLSRQPPQHPEPMFESMVIPIRPRTDGKK